jgi:hypothetical protein
VPQTLWDRVRGWLLASLGLNLAGVISGFVGNRAGDPTWLSTAQLVCALLAFGCLGMFFLRWKQYRATERAG